jgi:hypothetical protein
LISSSNSRIAALDLRLAHGPVAPGGEIIVIGADRFGPGEPPLLCPLGGLVTLPPVLLEVLPVVESRDALRDLEAAKKLCEGKLAAKQLMRASAMLKRLEMATEAWMPQRR